MGQREAYASIAKAECADEHARASEALAAKLRVLGMEDEAQKVTTQAIADRCDARGHRADAARLLGQKENG